LAKLAARSAGRPSPAITAGIDIATIVTFPKI
jgi:hypothetical protein